VGVATSTPFGRLALTHALSLGGDALVAMSLAGSLFFDVDPAGARWKIFLYLVFTMAPFAVVGPLIGPAMDRARGGHRMVLIGSCFGRVIVGVLMVASVGSDSLWLFPEAFLMLVLSKTYTVAKAAIVPMVVDSDAGLVEANSKLQLISGLAGFAFGIPGGVLLLIEPAATVFLAALVFAAASVASFRVPKTTVASDPPDEEERAELRSAAVLSASSAMGSLRAIVGFVTFLLAFALRGGSDVPPSGTALGTTVGRTVSDMTVTAGDLAPSGPPAWNFGVVIAASIGGGLLGAAAAPFVRRHIREEMVLLAAMGVAAAGGLAGLLFGGLFGQMLLSFCAAVSASGGKQAFDAVVQRDAPDANRGRLFARFESRFQVAWVLGAVVPVVIRIPTDVGGAMVMALAIAAGVFFAISMQAVRRGDAPPKLPTARGVSRQIRTRAAERRSRTVTRRPGDVARQHRERPPPGRDDDPTVSPRREDRGNPGPRTSRRRA